MNKTKILNYTIIIAVIIFAYFLIQAVIFGYALYSASIQRYDRERKLELKSECLNPAFELSSECKTILSSEEKDSWIVARAAYLKSVENDNAIKQLKQEIIIEHLKWVLFRTRSGKLENGVDKGKEVVKDNK